MATARWTGRRWPRSPHAAPGRPERASRRRRAFRRHGRGRVPDAISERMVVRLLPLATKYGFDQVGHVVLGRELGEVEQAENAFLVRGDLDDRAHLRAHIATHEAVGMSVEESLARLEKVNRRLALRLRPE
ncbi:MULTISPECIES: XVIPCD domain-containing protein [Xanthomonas translucens group]|uniref:XVIPCD domain-containing protein n=1 Tax=Xanthomonas translucens group TaxID=3390202 RepID=UPI0039647493